MLLISLSCYLFDEQAFFGIFDGHGGKGAAEFASENMGERIVEEVVMRGESCSEMEEAVKIGYLKTDAEFLKQDVGGGTCCVTALLRKGDLVVSNAGDCRAVLSRAGTAEVLTSDHKLSREDERERVESLVSLLPSICSFISLTLSVNLLYVISTNIIFLF